MLRLEGITYRAGGATILDDLALEVAPGRIVSLLGPSGSGKTSLLRAIMGLATPQRGVMEWDGTRLAAGGGAAVPPSKRPFAYLFQSFALFPHLDVRANILLGIHHRPRAERNATLQRLAALLGIEPLLRRPIHDLSGGEQQRVALARTLALEPRLLLLDEPFSNLDKMTKDGLYHEVKALIRRAGMAAILATHDQEEAFYFSDRLVVLDRGRVVAEDTPRVIYERPATAWLARFTGAANLLKGAALAAHLPDPPPLEPTGTYLIRPEHVRLLPETPPVGDGPGKPGARLRVTEVDFHGFFTTVAVESEAGLALRATLRGACDFTVGQSVGLALDAPPTKVRP